MIPSTVTNTGHASRDNVAIFLASMCLLNGGLGTGSALLMPSFTQFQNYCLSKAINTTSWAFYGQLQENSSKLIFEFRRISGLTWDKIAEIFGVTRRAVHFWANGKPMEDFRAEKLHYLITAIRKIDTGYAVQNRRILFAKNESGISLLDLFRKGDFYSVNMRMPSVAASSMRDFKSLSLKARTELEPAISPFDLLNADNSRIETKKTRLSAITVRKAKHES